MYFSSCNCVDVNKISTFYALNEMFWTFLIISIESIFIFQGGHLLFKAHASALRYQLLLNSTPVTWTDLCDRYPWINCTKVNRDRIDTKYLMVFFLGCNCKIKSKIASMAILCSPLSEMSYSKELMYFPRKTTKVKMYKSSVWIS